MEEPISTSTTYSGRIRVTRRPHSPNGIEGIIEPEKPIPEKKWSTTKKALKFFGIAAAIGSLGYGIYLGDESGNRFQGRKWATTLGYEHPEQVIGTKFSQYPLQCGDTITLVLEDKTKLQYEMVCTYNFKE